MPVSPHNNVTVNLNVSVDASGEVRVFGQTFPGFSGELVVANYNLPVISLYDEYDTSHPIALIEFWEPSGSLGSTSAQLANSTGFYNVDLSGAYLESAKRLVNGLQNVLCNEMDASGAVPFNDAKYGNQRAYKVYKSFGHLALGFYAHNLFGHAAATAAITNDTSFIENMLSLDQGTVTNGNTTSTTMMSGYKHDISGSLTKDDILEWSSLGTNSDADLARRLVYAIIKKGLDNSNQIKVSNSEDADIQSTLSNIVNQVIGQDASRAMGADNNELQPEEHQLLKFQNGDIIYINIKLTTPQVVFANNTPSGSSPNVNIFNSSNEKNYAIKITLKDILPFEGTNLAIASEPVSLSSYLDNLSFTSATPTATEKAQLYTQLQTYVEKLEAPIAQVSGSTISNLLSNSILTNVSEKTFTVAVPTVDNGVLGIDLQNTTIDENTNLYVLAKPGSTVALLLDGNIYEIIINTNNTLTYSGQSYSLGSSITLGNYTFTLSALGSFVLSAETITLAQPTLSYTGSPFTFTKNTAISSITPTYTTYNNSGTFTVSPSLPSGLSINGSTGVISGTPTSALTATNYTITLTDGATQTVTSTISITVNDVSEPTPDAPIISYSSSYLTLTKSTNMTPLSPTSTGGTVVSYSISGELPAGLSFNTSNGTISGTPTQIFSETSYTITATNTGGSVSVSVSIIVNDTIPVVTYPSTAVFTKGVEITNITPSNSGGSVTSYSISASLPAGLSFNTSTGTISGTPTVIISATNYTISSTNTGGTDNDVIAITVNDAAPSISYSSPQTYTKGTAISTLSPSVSGGAVVSYSISGELPSGLSFNTSTGTVTGTPTATLGETSYTITANNTGGSSSVQVTITVNDATPVISYSSPQTYTKGTAITTLSPDVSGGATIASYSISPSLPSGLSLNEVSGAITGTATSTSGETSYTVTATNSTGQTGTAILTITVNDATPVISYSSPQTYTKGTTISTLSPSVSGGATIVSYSISPSLPSGLSLNGVSGAITGTAIVSSGATTYTVTATNSTGQTGTTTLSITVNDLRLLSGYWIDASGTESSRLIAFDNSGNYYLTGTTTAVLSPAVQSVIGAKPGVGTAGFLIKYTAEGTPIWGQWLDGAGNEGINGGAVDSSNSVYVLGSVGTNLQNSLTSIIGNKPSSNTGMFVVKYNSAGTPVGGGWLDASGNETATSMAVSSSGNIYITGTATSDLQGALATLIGTKPAGVTNQGGFLAKYNSSMVPQWAKWVDGLTAPDVAQRVVLDASENVYLLGFGQGELQGSVTSLIGNKPGSTDGAFVIKYNSSGVPQWGRWIDGAGVDSINSAVVDTSGNLYIIGTAADTLQDSIVSIIGAKPDGATSTGQFILKYGGGGGALLGGRWIDGSGAETARGMNIDVNNNLYVLGTTNNELNGSLSTIVGGKPHGASSSGAYLIKYNSNLTPLTGVWIDGVGSDAVFNLAFDSSNNLYLYGNTNNELQSSIVSVIGTKPDGSVSQGAFVLKYGY